VQLLSQARQRADAIGYRRHLAFNLNNEAHLRAALGDPFAATCAAAAVERSWEIGDLSTVIDAIETWVSADPEIANESHVWGRIGDVNASLDKHLRLSLNRSEEALAAARANSIDSAAEAANSASDVARGVGLADVIRRANFALIAVRLHQVVPEQQAIRDQLLWELDSLSDEPSVGSVERAEFALERWRVTRDHKDQQRAASAMRDAFIVEPSAKVRAWFDAIGEPLPPVPTPLPQPIGLGDSRITRAQLDDALSRLEQELQQFDKGSAT
jgi:hypothetical protein